MNYINEELGRQLNKELEKGYNLVRISRWAFHIFYSSIKDLSITQRGVLEELFRMQDDPQFEYTEEELRMLSKKLINNEEDPIKQINDMKFKM